MLSKYIKNQYGHKIGIVLTIGKNAVGYSLCSQYDVFDQEIGFEIAYGRAMKSLLEKKEYKVPPSIKYEYNKMVERSNRYYKSPISDIEKEEEKN